MKNSRTKSLLTLRTGDPNSVLGKLLPEDILSSMGHPKYILSTSQKTEKCLTVDVLARVLYMTPGIYCSHATAGCLRACLGHCSGHMQMPTHAAARDRRAALYLADPGRFIRRVEDELTFLLDEAKFLGLQPAARLNGSSDIPWESHHPELFEAFPSIQFFDYTKNPLRMNRFLAQNDWPKNYHLTFSVTPENHREARQVMEAYGTVTVVFSPNIPNTWWSYPVIDGDKHDARFLDRSGVVVGLRAKGQARVDLTGFTVRPCPVCGPRSELELVFATGDSHLRTVHTCSSCGFSAQARFSRPSRGSGSSFQLAA